MESYENNRKKRKNRITEIIITQMVFVIITILLLLAVKCFFKNTFSEIKAWYKDNVCVTTDVNEVLKGIE